MLDEAGFPAAAIIASNDLDEHQIASLKARGACTSCRRFAGRMGRGATA